MFCSICEVDVEYVNKERHIEYSWTHHILHQLNGLGQGRGTREIILTRDG